MYFILHRFWGRTIVRCLRVRNPSLGQSVLEYLMDSQPSWQKPGRIYRTTPELLRGIAWRWAAFRRQLPSRWHRLTGSCRPQGFGCLLGFHLLPRLPKWCVFVLRLQPCCQFVCGNVDLPVRNRCSPDSGVLLPEGTPAVYLADEVSFSRCHISILLLLLINQLVIFSINQVIFFTIKNVGIVLS